MDEKLIQRLNAAISAIFVIAGAVLLVSFLKSRAGDAPAPDEGSTQVEAEAPAPEAYGDLAGMTRLDLAEDFASWTPEAKIDETKVRSLGLAVQGNVAKAYLTVRATLDGKPLTKYESVYVKFNDAGGHLFRPQSLETPEDGATSLLYDLSAVAVLPSVPYDETRTPETADLAAELKDGKTARLTAFISSLKPALLDEIALHYVCATDETCSISIR